MLPELPLKIANPLPSPETVGSTSTQSASAASHASADAPGTHWTSPKPGTGHGASGGAAPAGSWLRWMEREQGARVSRLGTDSPGGGRPQSFLRAVQPQANFLEPEQQPSG